MTKSSYQKLKHERDIYRQYIIELEYIIYCSQNKDAIEEVKNFRQKYQKLLTEKI